MVSSERRFPGGIWAVISWGKPYSFEGVGVVALNRKINKNNRFFSKAV